MGSRRHFKEHWKELIASQTAATDGDKETEEDELDEPGFPALVFFRRHRRGVLVGCLCVLAICAAVVHVYPHGSATGRRALHGRVQVDGVDVARGAIRFLPSAGNSGPAANASIVDGRYSFTRETGPHGGPHRVLIDVHSLPVQDGESESEQSMRGMKKMDVESLQEPDAEGGASEEQPQRSTKSHWELDYSVPEEGADRKDFELSG